MGRLILFKIGSLNVYTHGLFFVLAIIVSAYVLCLLTRNFSKNKFLILDIALWSLISGIVVARILFIILYHDQFHAWKDYVNLGQGGLVSWGGYAGGLGLAYILIKTSGENIKKWIDAIFISGMLGIAVGRIGCTLSGEAAGKAYSGVLNIAGKYPTTLLESFLSLLIFVVLIASYKKERFSDGFWWKASLLLYSFGRFVIDFTREEAIYYIGISLGQILSLCVTLVMFVLILIDFERGKNEQRIFS